MRRALRSSPRREAVIAAAWAVLFALLLAVRFTLQRSAAPVAREGPDWLRMGAVVLLGLLVLAAALGHRAPWIGDLVLRVEQGAVFVAVTRLLGLGAQPNPGPPEQVLIGLLVVHAIGAILVSDEVPGGTPPRRAGLWALAGSFAALTATLLVR